MVIGNDFSNSNSSSAFLPRKQSVMQVIDWNKEPLMRFRMRLWKQSHIYMQVLQLFAELTVLHPNAICIKFYDFAQPIEL
jgi:hypothetical protein